MANFQVRSLNQDDSAWIARFLVERWGSTHVVSRGRRHDPSTLPGFVATQNDKPVGLITYRIESGECEIVTIDSLVEGIGIGSALIDAVRSVAHNAGCKRLWLITTNDNTPAIRFYQKRGFALAALHRDAIRESRTLKPEISLIGMDGIPIRDEIEFEMMTGG
jgi:ribosomal protein S18 acetylase RimI-like enzyme